MRRTRCSKNVSSHIEQQRRPQILRPAQPTNFADILLTSSEGQGRTTKTSRHKTPIFFGTTSDARSHQKTRSDTVQRTQKPVGATPCQFDSDLRHHYFRHEKALQTEIWGASFFANRRKVSETFLTTPASADWPPLPPHAVACWARHGNTGLG